MLKGKMPLVIAAFLAVIAGILAFSAIQGAAKGAREGWELRTVLVADLDIAEGTEVTEAMLREREIPVRFITNSNINPGDRKVIRGQKISVNVQRGDPLLWSQFSMKRTDERLSKMVLKRMRAFTLKASDVSSVGGWIRPNDRIDIIGIFKDSQTQEPISMTLMQNVMVLATGIITSNTQMALMSDSDSKYGEISLMVLPEDVEQLALAQELGTLTFSLRNEEDAEMLSETRKTTLRILTDSEMQKHLSGKRDAMIEVLRPALGAR